jgi:HK97 family phage major capsid protein
MPTLTAEALADQIVSKVEAKQQQKAEADAALKLKAEKEAQEKILAAEEQSKGQADMIATAVEIAMRKLMEKEKLKGAEDLGAGNPPTEGAPGVLSGKFKMDKDSQQIMDALNSDSGKAYHLKFDLSVQDGEDRLRHMYRQAAREGKKADLDGASSYGSQLLPENWGTDLYMRMADLDGDLMRLFPKVGMTSYKHHISELLADITVAAYYSYQNQNLAIENVTATSPTTGDLALEARTFIAKTKVYDRLTADTKVNLIRGLRQKMAMKLGSKVSAAILNGDTTSTHMDEDLEADGANIPEAMFKGLRKLIMVGSLGTDGDTTFTLANLESIEKTMGKYAIGPNMKSCPLIVGVKGYANLKALYRASTSTPRAADFVLENGVVEYWNGHPVIISEHQREDLEIDGYQDETGASGAQGFLNLVQTNEFVIGVRQELLIDIIPDPLNGRRVLAGTILLDFQPFETPSTTIKTCSGLYAWTA